MKYELRKIIEEQNWWIEKEGDGYWRLSKYSPAGEDFYFIVPEKDTVEKIKAFCEIFDPEEHAGLLVDHRGTHGIPGSIKVLIDDAYAIADMLKDLVKAVTKTNEQPKARTKSSK